jgi:glycosyltransferase involved in cell wall biosynthesis
MIYSILHTEWSSGWGGQERRILLECQKVRALGHKVIIACQPESGIGKQAEAAGIAVEEVVIRGSFDLRAIYRLSRLIKKYGVNVVNTHSGKDSWAGGLAAQLAGADLLIRTRHLSVPLSNHWFNFIHKMADGIIATGTAIRDSLIEENGIAPEKVVSIATGVPLEHFTPGASGGADLRRELGLPADARVVTMVAVLRSMKRYDLLVAAGKILRQQFPDMRILIVGEGPGREWIEGLIREQGLEDRIVLAGYREDIPAILGLSDVVVLTSDRFEGVPQSLSQAMAMERPVVAAPIGSIPELVQDGRTGFLAETGSAESFAEKIKLLLLDDDLRIRLGKSARAHIVENYSADAMAEKTLQFYDRLLTQKDHRGRNGK